MKNKENKRGKSRQPRNKSASFETAHKKSAFSSMIFESGRNSLCSPRQPPPADKYNTYIQYISSGKFTPDPSHPRYSNVPNRPKAATPTPRRLSATLLEQGRKSLTIRDPRELPLRNIARNPCKNQLNSKTDGSPRSKNKSLFVKGSNVIKPSKKEQPQLKKKESASGNGFEKRKKGKVSSSEGRGELEERERRLVEKLFANIEFHRNLGRGAHALVRSGVDFSNKRKIAVKVYQKQELSAEETASIYNEVQVLGSLSHPAIIKLYEIIETYKTINLVMEYGGGNTLQQYIRNRSRGRLEEPEARTIYRAVVAGVAHIHASAVAHRDIKSENILLNKYLQVKIIDFGFSRKSPKGQLSTVFCGTPTYMPPEIVSKTPHSPFAADCWSLGILLYHMLHGHCPFKAQNQKELFQKIVQEEINLEEGHLSVEARDLLGKLLCLEPAQRLAAEQVLSHPWLTIQ